MLIVVNIISHQSFLNDIQFQFAYTCRNQSTIFFNSIYVNQKIVIIGVIEMINQTDLITHTQFVQDNIDDFLRCYHQKIVMHRQCKVHVYYFWLNQFCFSFPAPSHPIFIVMYLYVQPFHRSFRSMHMNSLRR